MRKRKDEEKDPSNKLRSAAADRGIHSVAGMARRTGIKKTTLQRRMNNISTLTVGELSLILQEFPLSDEKLVEFIREV